ncbi:MAG TPA: ElyC/SanA/YdcF family protein [Reyranella sp.]|nr:ElyC/SanA/YdcF family protein [Reyranella sp.]
MKPMRFLTIALALAALAVGGVLAIGAVASTAIDAWGEAYVVDDPVQLPPVDAVLVLGGSFYGKRGQDLWTLSWRMDAAAGLWHGGSADRFLVSGNRAGDDYDEPADMRDELVARGVPAEVIELDSRGLRTWDSIARAKWVYGKRRLLIVSQRDHLGRALFLARHIGLEAWGVPARGTNYLGLYGGMIRDLTSLVAYMDVVRGPPRAVIAAGSSR